MYGLVDEHRKVHGVEPICGVLQIAPSAYRRHAARSRNQALLSPRAQRDMTLIPVVEQVWNANLQVYGADKVWSRRRAACRRYPDGAICRTLQSGATPWGARCLSMKSLRT